MLAPPFDETEDLPAFRLRWPDGSWATIYESGYSEGLPEGTVLVNLLHSNQMMRCALRVAEAESPFE